MVRELDIAKCPPKMKKTAHGERAGELQKSAVSFTAQNLMYSHKTCNS